MILSLFVYNLVFVFKILANDLVGVLVGVLVGMLVGYLSCTCPVLVLCLWVVSTLQADSPTGTCSLTRYSHPSGDCGRRVQGSDRPD